MENENKMRSRKKFLWLGAGLLSFIAFNKWGIKKHTKTKKETVKMLTEDGRLVEVDIDKISSRGKKITDEAIHEWIKK